MNKQWSTTAPKRVGYYWLKLHAHDDAKIVDVYHVKGKLQMVHHGDAHVFDLPRAIWKEVEK